MTKAKWTEIYFDVVSAHNKRMDDTPDNWETIEAYPAMRHSLLKMIKDLDEATEVYNMENTKS